MKLLPFLLLPIFCACSTAQTGDGVGKGEVESELVSHKDDFRRCYESEIDKVGAPKRGGRVEVSFNILKDGWARDVTLVSTTLKMPAVEKCVLAIIKVIPFPRPQDGGMISVTYPFKFSPH